MATLNITDWVSLQFRLWQFKRLIHRLGDYELDFLLVLMQYLHTHSRRAWVWMPALEWAPLGAPRVIG